MSEQMSVTVECAPGTLTAAKALEIGEAWAATLNAVANEIDPTVGNLFAFKKMEWIDDGKDTLTLTVEVPQQPATGEESR